MKKPIPFYIQWNNYEIDCVQVVLKTGGKLIFKGDYFQPPEFSEVKTYIDNQIIYIWDKDINEVSFADLPEADKTEIFRLVNSIGEIEKEKTFKF